MKENKDPKRMKAMLQESDKEVRLPVYRNQQDVRLLNNQILPLPSGVGCG
jgi:hypothetical protein